METHAATPVVTIPRHGSLRAIRPAPGRRQVPVMTADFSAVYRNERDSLVRALTLSIGDHGLAAEAVDEAFTRALHRWHVVGQFDNPSAWIYRTARNWANSRFRRLTRDRRYAHRVVGRDRSDDTLPDPELARALDELDDDRRSVLILRFYLDWSVDQVADALDISPGTVKSRTHRALNELNHRLGGSP